MTRHSLPGEPGGVSPRCLWSMQGRGLGTLREAAIDRVRSLGPRFDGLRNASRTRP